MKRIDRVLKYKGSIVDVYDDVMQSPTGKIASARRCCWPQTSASVLGRRRCASGSFIGLPSKNDHENPSLL